MQVRLHLGLKKQAVLGAFHIKIVTLRCIPGPNILLRADNAVMERISEVISQFPKGEAMKVSMENGLPENSMFPENCGSIKLVEKPLDFLFECKEFFIKCSGHIAITGIVLSGDNEQVSLGKRGMVGNNAKCGCLFENVGGNVLMLAECASGTVCFSIQGEAAPMLHADDSLLQFHLTSLNVMPNILPSRVME